RSRMTTTTTMVIRTLGTTELFVLATHPVFPIPPTRVGCTPQKWLKGCWQCRTGGLGNQASTSSVRRDHVPRHGEPSVADAATGDLDGPALIDEHGAGLLPAHARAVGFPARGVIPGGVGSSEQRVDLLTGHIAVDEHLGQALGHIRGARHTPRVPGQSEGLWAARVQQDPAAPPTDLVAGALDEHPAGSQARGH